MRVRILRNLGTSLVRELATGGLTIPEDLVEGQTVDIGETAAEALFTRRLAEPLTQNKPAPAPAAQPKTEKPTQ